LLALNIPELAMNEGAQAETFSSLRLVPHSHRILTARPATNFVILSWA